MSAAEDQFKSRIAILINYHSSIFGRAEAYTKLVLVAGYGGFFAMWHLVKSDLPSFWASVAALSMTLSIACFVLFEVWKMIRTTGAMVNVAKAISENAHNHSDVFVAAFAKAETDSQISIAGVMRFWRWALVPTLFFGLIAFSIFLVCLIVSLF
jgi:hypothetical protein